MPLLSELLARAKLEAAVTGDAATNIKNITSDSRAVTPGALFLAMPGVKADGTHYIPEALRNGAAAIAMASTAKSDVVATVPILRAIDMRAAISQLAAAFYPQQPTYNFAITGTDGKTSTADFVRQLAELLGHKSASIGTLGLRSPIAAINDNFPATNTSPEPILLHRTLSELAAAGVNYAAIEASSHGLDQKRLDSVNFTAGAFTNLGRDHLDYHATIDDYFAAKALLFTHVLQEGASAILNRDDARYNQLAALCNTRKLRIISFGTHDGADYHISQITPHAHGLKATLNLRGKTHALDIPLYGAFQLFNMLTAMGLLQAANENEEKIVSLLPYLKGVPGRLEKIVDYHGATVFVDYAHTPAALENILKTLRPHTEKKLHVVFGCGGDRDAGKRPEMGAVASRLADHIVITDDNPRSENAAAIRAAILAQAPGAEEIGDRAEAIHSAMQKLQPGDVLVVAGKGHETTQTIGTNTYPFNDADTIRKAGTP